MMPAMRSGRRDRGGSFRLAAGVAGTAALSISLLLMQGCQMRERADSDWPHILLISLDALRADHLSGYGYHRPTSPFLDELAARGVRFSNAFVNTHGTPPSHTTLLTSLYQETHGVGFQSDPSQPPDEAVPQGVVMLQELLYANGYQTVAVTDGGYMSAEYGFGRGFQDYFDEGYGIEKAARRLSEALRRRLSTKEPIFAFLHTYEIHSPYTPPEEYRTMFGRFESDLDLSNENLIPIQSSALEHLQPGDLEFLKARYDGGIRYTDDTLRKLFARLEELGFMENCLVIVTSDHGEEFGDHGGLLHREMLYEELLKVPLIIWGRGVDAGRVDERSLVSSIDVVPTVLARLDLKAKLPLAGIDLLSPEDREKDRPVYSQYGQHRYSIRTRRWKLIETPAEDALELYDLRNDPQEKVNLAGSEEVRALNLRRRLHLWKKECPRLDLTRRPVRPTAELVERLKSLGYVR